MQPLVLLIAFPMLAAQEAPENHTFLQAQEEAPEVTRLLRDPDPAVRLKAIWSLGELGAKPDGKKLVPFLDNRDPVMRHGALYALGRIGRGPVAGDVTRLLKDPQPLVRVMAAEVLGKLGGADPKIGDALIELLKDKDGCVRARAAEALGRLGYRKAIPELTRLLGDYANVGKAVKKILKPYLPPKVDSEALNKWRYGRFRRHERSVRDVAAYALCQFGSKKGVPGILKDARYEWMLQSYVVLNAVRDQSAWQRLRKMRIEQTTREKWITRGSHELLQKVLDQAATELGLPVPVKIPPLSNEQIIERSWGRIRRLPPDRRGKAPLTFVLEDVLWDTGFNVILEKDKIRVLPTEECLAFWKSWSESEQKKQPEK